MIIPGKGGKASRRRKAVYLIAPTILMAGAAVGLGSHSAHAAANACDFPTGKTSNLKLGANGVTPTGGTTWTKPSGTSCADLNVSKVSATDSYEGWLQTSSTGKWAACSKGFVKINSGQQSTTNPPVLCTGVKAGTVMAVVQESATQRSITIED
jgi:hypothetical protein